jgi:hypothetical protein
MLEYRARKGIPVSKHINREWHEQNQMPKNPSFQQRLKWHTEHRDNCSCRPMPKTLAEQARERGIDLACPDPRA